MRAANVRIATESKARVNKRAFRMLSVLVFSCVALAQQNARVTVQDSTSLSDSVSVQVVKFDDVPVKAGDPFSFTFKLDRAPSFSGVGILFVISGPDGTPRIQTSAPCIPGEQECRGSVVIPFAAPGGTWTLSATGISDGISIHPPKPNSRTFQVIANQGLTLPNIVDIVVNPSQQQLLRLEARHLQQKIEDLKAAIVAYQEANQRGRITGVLRSNVEEALRALDRTEAEFESRATSRNSSDTARTFFADLKLSYDAVALELDRNTARENEHGQLIGIGLSTEAHHDSSYPILAQATLRAFEGNELAYSIAADTGLTFDLKVTSNPAGAVVSYHRRGDPPHMCPEPTATVIPSLPLAVWYVKVEKPGYKSQEREHDAIRSTDHVLNVELVR